MPHTFNPSDWNAHLKLLWQEYRDALSYTSNPLGWNKDIPFAHTFNPKQRYLITEQT